MRGTFWIPTDPGRVRPGSLDMDEGSLVSDGDLVDCTIRREVRDGVYVSRPRNDDHLEYRIFGQTADGVLITIPAAVRGVCDHKVEPSPQEFHFTQAIRGVHTGEADGFDAVEVRWPTALGDWSGPIDVSGIGVLRFETDGGTMFVRDLPFLTVATTLRRVVEPVRALLDTMTGAPAAPNQIQLTDSQGRSASVHTPTLGRRATQARTEPFFHQSRLRVTHLRRWFEMVSKTHPILAVAARALDGTGTTLEAQTMTLAAVAEGLHEQLHGHRALDKPTAQKLREAASAAVPEAYRARVAGALSQLGSQTFRDRLEWLAANLEPFASELCGATTDGMASQAHEATKPSKPPRTLWANYLMAARNNFAHQKPESPDDLDAYVKRALALREAAQWFVVACILRDLGVPVSEIEGEFKRKSSYHLFRGRARRALPDVFGRPATDDPLAYEVEA